MSDKRVSETGKRISEMNTSALNEAAAWADQLMEAETKSRREKEYVVRDRLSKKIGVSASYLFRLQYKISEMNDVRGSVYRALMMARDKYGLAAAERSYASERKLADERNSKMVGFADFVAGSSGVSPEQ